MTHSDVVTSIETRWQILGTVISAHCEALARQGSFGEDVSQTLSRAADNVRRTPARSGTLLAAALAFDEHLDTLVPAHLKGVASMGRGTIEVCHAVVRITLRSELTRMAESILALSEVLLQMAGVHIVTMVPIWSGNQPVQPTTLAGLLSGPAGSLTRALDLIDFSIGQINQSPLGAGSGAATRFTPDRSELAVALGFDRPISSVYDAASATDYLTLAATAIETTVVPVVATLELLDQIVRSQPEAIVFAEEHSARVPDVPQLRRPSQMERAFAAARLARREAASVRSWVDSVPAGLQFELDEPFDALLAAFAAAQSLLEGVAALFSGGFDVNRAVLGNRAGKDHITSSDIVDFLVIEEGINPADARTIATRVLAQLRANGQEVSAIDRSMIDGAGLLILGREIGIEFETLSKYLAPRRFLEGRTAEGGPSPAAMRAWLTHETAVARRRRTAFAELRQRWDSVVRQSDEVDETSAP